MIINSVGVNFSTYLAFQNICCVISQPLGTEKTDRLFSLEVGAHLADGQLSELT